MAAAGGSSSNASSSKQQYCPPSSPNGGNPQGGPGNNCGNPPDKCPNGNPKPPSGNCGNPPDKCPNGNPKPPSGNCGKGTSSTGLPGTGPKHPSSSGEGSSPTKRRARVRLHKHPRKGCVSRKFAARISISNKAKGRKVVVFRDGHRIRSTGSSAFRVHFNVRQLSRGVHTLKIQVRGQDGHVVTKVLRFRRC